MPYELVMSTAMSAEGVAVRYVCGTPTDLTTTLKHQGQLSPAYLLCGAGVAESWGQ
jgi:hypothetical protein